ncbi:MAG: cytidylate kinase-like family protein [bacterium]|nr:cytidylate kinase-like family protein [bacterium]
MPYSAMDKYINSQVSYWKSQKEKVSTKEEVLVTPYVTVSREYGCGGYDVAVELIRLINEEFKPEPVWAAYDRKLLEKVMTDMGLSSSLTETLTNNARKHVTNLIQTTFSKFPPQVAVYKKLVETIGLLAANGNVVIVGRAANVITRNIRHISGGYHVRIVAPMEWRAEQMAEKQNLSKKEATKMITEKSKERGSFLKEFVKFDVENPHNYHMYINNSEHSNEEAARLILEGMKIKELLAIK